MQAKTVVVLDDDERREVQDALTQIALAFPERDDGGADADSWKLLKRLAHHDTIFDLELLGSLDAALEIAGERLAPMTQKEHWLPAGAAGTPTAVPGSRPPEEVLAESALLGLRSLERLRQLLLEAAQLASTSS